MQTAIILTLFRYAYNRFVNVICSILHKIVSNNIYTHVFVVVSNFPFLIFYFE